MFRKLRHLAVRDHSHGRYLDDVVAIPGGMPSDDSPSLTAWGRAHLTARDAHGHAARHLQRHTRGTRVLGVTAHSELARQFDAAAMAAGRDLLHTHLARDVRGARQFRSEWGLVVCSPQAERALLAQLAWLAYQIAPACTDVALAARSPDTADAQCGLRAACGWLRVLGGSVQAAHWANPVSATDHDLLLTIPLNAPTPPHPGRQRAGHLPERRRDHQRRTSPSRRLGHRLSASLVTAPDRGLLRHVAATSTVDPAVSQAGLANQTLPGSCSSPSSSPRLRTG